MSEVRQIKPKNMETMDKEEKIEKKSISSNKFILISIIIIAIAILNQIGLKYISNNKATLKRPKYWVFSVDSDVHNPNGLLKHVHNVLNRVGFEMDSNETDWSLLWAHDYPFRAFYPQLHKLKAHQRVNHFPGTGYITVKVDLATTKSKFIPKAFKLPKEKDEFLNYTKRNPDKLFLEKNNQHRGVFLKNISDINLNEVDIFVQEFVDNPFLVDGYKFDIGVYVVLTSVKPLRLYLYKGDVLFRYCPTAYYPFDGRDLDKYVIRDDYRPTWEVPSLINLYKGLGHSMKDAFDAYVTMQGNYPETIWNQVEEAITEIFLLKEHHIIESLKSFPSQKNFFELMRVDLIIDDNLKVHLIEANMSPNLSSAHFLPNQLLYEQIIYNLFSITGISSYLQWINISEGDKRPSKEMITSQKNIAVWSVECTTMCKTGCTSHIVCSTCKPCLDKGLSESLMNAHYEHLHSGDFRRIYPKSMQPNRDINQLEDTNNLSMENNIQNIWYQGKCNADHEWC